VLKLTEYNIAGGGDSTYLSAERYNLKEASQYTDSITLAKS
jgi:hypothetical protein